ncbi:MAG: hypothetical protein K9K38_11830 [Rhodoferax sp.]|nr:hypothetical protein [Rhodoferax sp.]
MMSIHERGRAAAVIRMRVLHGTLIIHVQAVIWMMMVIGILAMHHQMFNITCSLRDGCWTKRRRRLQKQGSQQDKGAKAKKHVAILGQ